MNNLLIQDLHSEDTYIFVDIHDASYAIGAQSVVEIVKMVHLDCPESLPRHIAGIVEYNSIIINIVDLRSILNLPPAPYTLDNQIIIIATDEMIFGVIIDRVTDIKKIDKSFLQSAPYKAEHTFTQAIYTEDEENAIFLSIASIEGAIKDALEDNTTRSECSALLPKDYDSVRVLRQRSLQLSKKNITPTSYPLLKEKDQYMSFKAGDTTYCMKIEFIKSFCKISQEKITRVPCTPKFIVGLLNVKGDCITLIDVREYLNSGTTDVSEKSIVIVLNSGEFKLGFVVDKIGDTINIPTEELCTMNADPKAEQIDCVRDDKLYYILNIAHMLNNEKLYIR